MISSPHWRHNMLILNEALILYNANIRSKNVGDCVKRGISLAYNKPYSEVEKDLNAKKREYGASAWNVPSIFEKVMNDYSDGELIKMTEYDQHTSVEEFAETHPDGVYIVLCGETYNDVSHMCVVMNGDVYDSWNSLNYIVVRYYLISESHVSTHTITPDEMNTYTETAEERVAENLKDISDKYNLGMGALSFATSVVNSTKFAIGLYARTREGSDYDIKQVDYYVFSPRMTSDECIEYVNKRTDELTKKFTSAIRKAIKEREEALEFGEESTSHFNAEGQRLLAKLPAWCRNRVLDLRMERGFWDARNVEYYVDMKPLPNDSDQSKVRLHADNLTDLKYIINEYKKSFERIVL